MKEHRQHRSIPSPATIIAIVALFVALGGTAYAIGRNSVGTHQIKPRAIHAKNLGPTQLRWGKLQDTDTTAGDGQFNTAFGHAQCRRGERLISGGLRARRSPNSGPLQIAMTSSGPVIRKRQWFVTMHSDLGGAARKNFLVFAYCLRK
jgi:hypothetical protein